MSRADAVTTQAAPGSIRRNAWSYRGLVWNFAVRDLKSRFRGSLLGWAWSLMLPVATIIIYTVVFSVIIRVEPPPFGNGEPGIYAVWLLVGLIPWNFIQLGGTGGIPSLLGTGPLLQKIYFPALVPCVASVIAIGAQSLIELAILLAILVALGSLGVSWLLLPVWIALLVGLVLAVNFLLAIGNVYFRDLGHIAPIVFQLLFFLSPVIYPITLVPEEWNGIPVRAVMSLNPFAQLISVGRSILYEQTSGSLWAWSISAGWTVAAVLAAVAVHRRWGRDVGEAI